MENQPEYTLELAVRDYECDLQGIVNNSVYMNYLEHARHEYLKSTGIDFASLAARKINLVVVRIEADYKSSLMPGDLFSVSVKVERISPLRFCFLQEIRRIIDNRLIIQAKVIGSALNANGRPELPKELEDVFGK
ncbi:MAG: acyl-CoA thioesterase [Bacteroidota bacterium]